MSFFAGDAFWFPLLLGCVSGVVSMLVYGRFSPQVKLQSLKLRIEALQGELATFEGDFSGAMALTRENLRLTFQRLGLVLWPSLISGIPVLAALPLVEHSLISYFSAVVVAALTTKYLHKIA
mgnify:CR=1 FL=1